MMDSGRDWLSRSMSERLMLSGWIWGVLIGGRGVEATEDSARRLDAPPASGRPWRKSFIGRWDWEWLERLLDLGQELVEELIA